MRLACHMHARESSASRSRADLSVLRVPELVYSWEPAGRLLHDSV